jgi:hypothetical protein
VTVNSYDDRIDQLNVCWYEGSIHGIIRERCKEYRALSIIQPMPSLLITKRKSGKIVIS